MLPPRMQVFRVSEEVLSREQLELLMNWCDLCLPANETAFAEAHRLKVGDRIAHLPLLPCLRWPLLCSSAVHASVAVLLLLLYNGVVYSIVVALCLHACR
jgi:hypothetical protein